VRAAGVALLVAVWPACNSNVSPPRPTETPSLDFVMTDMTGQEVALADFRGKPLLINFWATWCGPCKIEVPWFVEFTERYKEQQFTVVGISLDDPVEEIRAFAEQYQVNYTMLVGKGREEVARAGQGHRHPRQRVVREPDRGHVLVGGARMNDHWAARLACGCCVTFREGVEGSPVTVVLETKSPGCVMSIHVAGLPIFDHREALRPSTRLLPTVQTDYEES